MALDPNNTFSRAKTTFRTYVAQDFSTSHLTYDQRAFDYSFVLHSDHTVQVLLQATPEIRLASAKLYTPT